MRRVMALAAAVALALLPVSPAFAATAEGQRNSLVVLQGDAVVPAGETVDAVVAFDGAVRVDGTVRQSVVAFHGPVTITGSVERDVVVFDGQLRLLSGSTVGGNVVAKDPMIAPGARVEGTVSSTWQLEWAFQGAGVVFGLLVWFMVAVSVLVLGFILLGLAPRAADATYAAMRASVGGTIGWGLLVVIGLPIVGMVAIATLVGLPLGLGILLALALLFGIGHTTGAWLLGRSITHDRSRAVAFLLGWAILSAAALVPVLGQLVWLGATVMGLGGLVLALWHARRATAEAPVPQIPPAPLGHTA
ncbi:MAG: hypothetical protein ACM3OO_02345 [Planctomycetaceae bacterium]